MGNLGRVLRDCHSTACILDSFLSENSLEREAGEGKQLEDRGWGPEDISSWQTRQALAVARCREGRGCQAASCFV